MLAARTDSVSVVTDAAWTVPTRKVGSRRSPALLALVFGVFLTIIGVTSSAVTVLVSAHLSTSRLESVVQDDTGVVRIVVNGTLTPADLDRANLTPDRLQVLQTQLSAVVSRGGMLRVEVRAPDGGTLFSSDGRALSTGPEADFLKAAGGASAASIVPAPDPAYGTSQLIVEQLPIISGGKVIAVFVVARDAVPILAGIDGVRREIVLVILAAALLVAFFLYLIFRSAHRRLGQQTRALFEATRHDSLTGSLNHGELVTELAGRLEAARSSGDTVAIALIDIDGFRLFNDTHGHGAGDAALMKTFTELARVAPEGTIVGRYGPDEFLLIAPAGAPSLEPAVQELRRCLIDTNLQFEESERLPITVSTGLCTYPHDAQSVTGLLAVGASTVAAAKASGGDAVRFPDAAPDGPVVMESFDILRGLVNSVDTKDRYTKRHSEDVARYADVIADRLGLAPEMRDAIHVAALLHDVGKIGIPDALLRKPAKLTADEYNALAQHVVLGDMIVRGLQDVDLIRAGIRHHHERFDGNGHPDGLAGRDIPLIARILSVADTYSAMTTTRPYRVALEPDEAVRRLQDAAGSQLDAELVPILVDAVLSGEVPELPESDSWRSRIWAPVTQVA